VRTLEDALPHGSIHLLSLELDKDMVIVIFNMLKRGIKSNLLFDSEESKIDVNIIARSIKSVIVKHELGDMILEQNILIDEAVYDQRMSHGQ
jgi:membrane-associated HD superfamily phosphohydrolase